MTNAPSISTYRELVNELLDQEYDQATQAVLRSIAASGNTGAVGKRLRDLDESAAALDKATRELGPDNALTKRLRRDFENSARDVIEALDTSLKQQAKMIDGTAPLLQESGAAAAGEITKFSAFGGADPGEVIGVQWNNPDPEAVARLVDYTGRDEWNALLKKYQSDISDTVQGVFIRGIAEGKNPRQIARELRRVASDFPPYMAENLMRTLQLTSYREAGVAHRLANADILDYQIRIAARDERTCMACLALHGTRLELDERVDDHHQGRCDSIVVVKGRPRTVQSGEDWFRGLPESRQRSQMGSSAFEAWKAGKMKFSDFVGEYQDDVFGRMVREQSLKGFLGDAAKDYYKLGRENALPRSNSSSTDFSKADRERAAVQRDVEERRRRLGRNGVMGVDNTPTVGGVPIPPRPEN